LRLEKSKINDCILFISTQTNSTTNTAKNKNNQQINQEYKYTYFYVAFFIGILVVEKSLKLSDLLKLIFIV